MRKIFSVADTGAGPNFIRKVVLPPEAEIDTGSKLPDVSDANDNPIHMLGATQQVVRLGQRVVSLTFIVHKTLAAPLILGCDFCDRFVEAIFPRQKNILMDDGSTLPITRRPLSLLPKLAPLSLGQVCEKDHGRTSPKTRISEKTELPPESQTWVTVTSQRNGVMVVQPNDALYANHSIAPTDGVVQTTPGVPFHILVAKFGKHRKSLTKNQVLGSLLPHPVAMYPSNVMLADVLGLPKPYSGENTASNANHPPQPEATESPKEHSTAIDELDLAHVPEQHGVRLRELLWKYSSI